MTGNVSAAWNNTEALRNDEVPDCCEGDCFVTVAAQRAPRNDGWGECRRDLGQRFIPPALGAFGQHQAPGFDIAMDLGPQRFDSRKFLFVP